MDRRAEGDKHTRKKQCARAAAKNVSAKFVVRFHSYTSVLRREPWSRLTLREEGQVELRGRRLTNLTQADVGLCRHKVSIQNLRTQIARVSARHLARRISAS